MNAREDLGIGDLGYPDPGSAPECLNCGAGGPLCECQRCECCAEECCGRPCIECHLFSTETCSHAICPGCDCSDCPIAEREAEDDRRERDAAMREDHERAAWLERYEKRQEATS